MNLFSVCISNARVPSLWVADIGSNNSVFVFERI